MKYFSKKLFKTLLFSFNLSVFLLTGCGSKTTQVEPLKRTDFALGTVATISLYDHQSEDILDEVFDRISELEDAISINKTGTLLDEINANAGISPVEVDSDTFNVIKKALTYSKLTEGSFDITVGPLVKLWSIGFPEARVPSETEIQTVLPLIDYNKVVLDEDTQTVFLKDKKMLIDLGGIGKGYVADEIIHILKANEVESAIIDLGGNLFAYGQKYSKEPWKIGVQDPFNPRGSTIGHMLIENKSIVTSGIYERYLEQDGVKYHHILNPETGYPFDNDIAGVTIISDSSADGDAISTSVFSKGIEEGLAFIDTLDGIDAIFITKDKKLYLTSGIKDDFVLTNKEFELAQP